MPNDDYDKITPERLLEDGDHISKYVSVEFMDDFTENEVDDQSEPMDEPEGELLKSSYADHIIITMDIKEPLTTLRELLEKEVGLDLSKCGFTLQDQDIPQNKNLVDLCVQGEGNVQIKCELKESTSGITVNISDVLVPSEEFVEIEDGADFGGLLDDRWAVAADFKRDQEKHGIPEDPAEWTVDHVRHWLMWAIRQFSLTEIKLSEWAMTGAEILNMTTEEFRSRVPGNTNSAFWTHFELLRTCKIVAVYKVKPEPKESGESEQFTRNPDGKWTKIKRFVKAPLANRTFKMGYKGVPPEYPELPGAHLSGCVQLWQFLLELLTSKDHRNAIQWLEEEGEFHLVDPTLVAHLWGIKKNRPTMNYEKLSRALRYYYDGDMISKVNGKRYTYKFVCDLKQLLGYSSLELNARVIEAELRDKFMANNRRVQTLPDNGLQLSDTISILP